MSDELQPGTGDNALAGNEQTENLISLDLGIGDAIQLQDTAAANLRYYVKLIGFLNKSGVIVSHPLKDGELMPVEDGKSFLVRGFSGRKTYEFNAYVLASGTVPYPHLHLTFPKQIECMSMRGALRIKPKSLSGWIEPWGTASIRIKEPMIVVDMSTSGARVLARNHFGSIGDQVIAKFHLPIDGEEQFFSIPGLIRKSYRETLPDNLGGGEMTTYGLEFLHPEGHVRMALQGYIYKTMAEGGD
ncbi:MAG: flagellar brake protein [Nitrosomonadales bacterium]|nr:flagellar brake protein [Nitrosomonadales bacterium]